MWRGVGKGDRAGKAANKKCVLNPVTTVGIWGFFLHGSYRIHFQVVAAKELADFYTNSLDSLAEGCSLGC